MFDDITKTVGSYSLRRGEIRYRVDVEKRIRPATGRFTATAYILDTASDGQERWAHFDIERIDAETPELAMEAAMDALRPRGKEE